MTTRDERGRLDSLLAVAGADVVHVPLISIQPATGPDLAEAMSSIGDFDWLIVTSRHGAERVGDAAAAHPELRLAAVGTRTAAVLEASAGRPVDVVPERQTAADLARAMAGRTGRACRLCVICPVGWWIDAYCVRCVGLWQ